MNPAVIEIRKAPYIKEERNVEGQITKWEEMSIPEAKENKMMVKTWLMQMEMIIRMKDFMT